jgi:hypothetical protein
VAAGALLVGVAATRADELADLQASQAALIAQQASLDKEQELLKARIDQLAPGPSPGTGVGALGTPAEHGAAAAFSRARF